MPSWQTEPHPSSLPDGRIPRIAWTIKMILPGIDKQMVKAVLPAPDFLFESPASHKTIQTL